MALPHVLKNMVSTPNILMTEITALAPQGKDEATDLLVACEATNDRDYAVKRMEEEVAKLCNLTRKKSPASTAVR